MSLPNLDCQDNSDYALICSVDNARNISQLLKAVHFKDASDTSHVNSSVYFPFI